MVLTLTGDRYYKSEPDEGILSDLSLSRVSPLSPSNVELSDHLGHDGRSSVVARAFPPPRAAATTSGGSVSAVAAMCFPATSSNQREPVGWVAAGFAVTQRLPGRKSWVSCLNPTYTLHSPVEVVDNGERDGQGAIFVDTTLESVYDPTRLAEW
jgi:hypothetical protein